MAGCTTILTAVNPEPRIRSVSPSHNSLVSLLPPKPSHSYSTIQYVIIHSSLAIVVKCKQPDQSINLYHKKNETEKLYVLIKELTNSAVKTIFFFFFSPCNKIDTCRSIHVHYAQNNKIFISTLVIFIK